jgi:membrane-bound lytic murein transglycosylase A
MKTKLPYIIVLAIILSFLSFFLWKPEAPVPVEEKLSFKQATFSQLPGWKTADTKKSLQAFQISCKAFLKQNPDKSVGSDYVDLKAKDWQPACQAALELDTTSNKKIKAFFQEWFMPVEFFKQQPVEGLFTGYYMPLLQGSLKKTEKYNVPLYGLPSNLVTVHLRKFSHKFKHRILVGRLQGKQVVPFYTRRQINHGAIKDVAPVIAWVNSKVDRSFLEIQGSGVIALDDGTQLVVGYSGENGAPYTSIAKVLIDKGVMTKDNASMQHIRRYLAEHPKQMDRVLDKNKSFVFFSVLKKEVTLGSQGVALTPGYSLAIDKKWVPLGAPIWLNTTRPDHKSEDQKTFQRLMIAQDTGGAIKGMVRGDVYWGAGERATSIAGKMKNPGHYWLLLPKHTLTKLQDKIV